jgi:hypothetical protein
MPTNNPKVSAYIPQGVFDRFQLFCKEKEISMSQAVAVIFTEYFEIEPQVNSSGGLLLDRIKDLELKVDELMGLKSGITGTQVELGRIEVSLPNEPLNSLEIASYEDGVVVYNGHGDLSELDGSSPSELKSEPFAPIGFEPHECDAVDQKDLSELNHGLPDEPFKELEVKIAGDLVNQQKLSISVPEAIGGISARELSVRLSCDNSNLGKKAKSLGKDFINWSKKKDPEGIAWEYREQDKKYYPLPASLSEGEAEAQTNHP